MRERTRVVRQPPAARRRILLLSTSDADGDRLDASSARTASDARCASRAYDRAALRPTLDAATLGRCRGARASRPIAAPRASTPSSARSRDAGRDARALAGVTLRRRRRAPRARRLADACIAADLVGDGGGAALAEAILAAGSDGPGAPSARAGGREELADALCAAPAIASTAVDAYDTIPTRSRSPAVVRSHRARSLRRRRPSRARRAPRAFLDALGGERRSPACWSAPSARPRRTRLADAGVAVDVIPSTRTQPHARQRARRRAAAALAASTDGSLTMQFPEYRPRRLRRTESLRRMVRETALSPSTTSSIRSSSSPAKACASPIASMPGQSQVSVDEAVEAAEECPRARHPGGDPLRRPRRRQEGRGRLRGVERRRPGAEGDAARSRRPCPELTVIARRLLRRVHHATATAAWWSTATSTTTPRSRTSAASRSRRRAPAPT